MFTHSSAPTQLHALCARSAISRSTLDIVVVHRVILAEAQCSSLNSCQLVSTAAAAVVVVIKISSADSIV